MANFKNSNYYLISNAADTVPASASGTGTVSTAGTAVTGTGTAFLTELLPGSWLIDFASNEIRLVTAVSDDTTAYIQQAFTAPLAGVNLAYVDKNNLHAYGISVQVPSTEADITVDGETLYAGTSVSFTKDSRNRSTGRDFVNPIVVDATGSVAQIIVEK